jgi:hypothetical protein
VRRLYAADGDDEALPALRAGIADAADLRAVTRALHHTRREPAVDVGREVADDVAALGVDPHARLLDPGRVGYEDQPISLAETMDDAGALAEDSPIDGGLEARRVGED